MAWRRARLYAGGHDREGRRAAGVAGAPRRDRSGGLACRTGRRLPAGQGRDERHGFRPARASALGRSEEHTSELQSLMRISYAVFCLKKKKKTAVESNHIPSI